MTSIFKPSKLSIFLFDKRYQQRMEMKPKGIPDTFVLRKMALSQTQTFLTLAKNELQESGPYLFKSPDDLQKTIKHHGVLFFAHSRKNKTPTIAI
jgi:hypothetical protein